MSNQSANQWILARDYRSRDRTRFEDGTILLEERVLEDVVATK